MSFRGSWRRRSGAVGIALVAVAALTVSGSAFGGAAQSCGTVTINEQSWSGSTANTYVAKYVLEKNLGCKVKITNVTEGTPYFQAMRDGKIDVALEDWDNTLAYVGAAVHQGQVGPGHRLERDHRRDRLVHPAVPAQAVPGVRKSWKGIKGKEAVFKSPESGSQGMFLGGDPSYVQKDRALIKELGLNLKHVVAGAEPAQVARWSQLYKQKKPVLFYWYDPQYLNAQYDLVRVKLPARFKGCLDDEKQPGKHACEYPSYGLDKLISGKFATSGSPALKFVKKWKWTSADQNFVANLIAGKKLKPEKAAEQWVKANKAKVNAWLK